MEAITTTLKSLHIGEAQHFRNLTAFPLIQPGAAPARYVTLETAISKGTARITEISDGGSVPELLLDNTGPQRILILDGEELVGAKQNRVANLSILAEAMSTTVIPVSCVEQGRWSYRSEVFNVSKRAHFSRGRAMKHVALSENMKATGTHGADQGMVWNEISAKAERMAVQSPTEAMADMYDQHDGHVEDYAGKFRAVAEQVGVIFAIDGNIEGMDLFAAPDTFKSMLAKLTRSFAIDALETAAADKPQAQLVNASHFLDRVAAAQVDSYPGIGVGQDLRLTAPQVAGGGLLFEDKLIHLAAFSVALTPRSGERDDGSLVRARMRARHRASMQRLREGNDNVET